MLSNKINYTQIAKKLSIKGARSMYFIDNNDAYLSDGVFILRLPKGEFDNLVSGYDLAIKDYKKNATLKTIYDNLVEAFRNVHEQCSFLHFYYKDAEKSLRYANLDGEVLAVNKTYIELVGPEKRNGEVVFTATSVKTPIRLLDNLFVCPVLNTNTFKELEFIFANKDAKEKPVETAKQEEAPKQTEHKSADLPFEVKDGTRAGFFEFYFKEKPSAEVLQLLKGFNMHWNRNKSCWFGYVNKDETTAAIVNAISKAAA